MVRTPGGRRRTAVAAAALAFVGVGAVALAGRDAGPAVGDIEIVGDRTPASAGDVGRDPTDEDVAVAATDDPTEQPTDGSAPTTPTPPASPTPAAPAAVTRDDHGATAGDAVGGDREDAGRGLPDDADPDVAGPSPPGRGSGDVEDGPRPQRVELTGLPGTTSWGATPARVVARATSGLPVALSADGACSLDGAGVRWTGVGDCVVVGRQAGDRRWEPASARVTVPVGRASPVIRFDDVAVRFERGLRLPLWAVAEPSVPLRYSLLEDDPEIYNEDPCRLVDDTFVFADGSPPALTAMCAIRVEGAERSPFYAAPSPVTAYVRIGFPAWRVDVLDPPSPVSYSADGPRLVVGISEGSGAAYGMAALVTGDCRGDGPASDYGDPDEPWVVARPVSRAGAEVLRYAVDVVLDDPSTVTGSIGTCRVTAVALPEDHEGGVHRDDSSFEIVP